MNEPRVRCGKGENFEKKRIKKLKCLGQQKPTLGVYLRTPEKSFLRGQSVFTENERKEK